MANLANRPEEAESLVEPGSKGIINAQPIKCKIIPGYPTRAVKWFVGLETNERFLRQSLVEEVNCLKPRLTTRKEGTLYKPLSDTRLLNQAVEYKDFDRAVRDDPRFKQLFDVNESWDNRTRMLYVVNITEKEFACQIASREDATVQWSKENPREVTICMNDLPGNVVQAILKENVTLTCTLTSGVQIQEVGQVKGVLNDNVTLVLSSCSSRGWKKQLRGRNIDITFSPRPVIHSLLATAAMEGVAVMKDTLHFTLLFPDNDRHGYVVDDLAIANLRLGNLFGSSQCTLEQRNAAVQMLKCSPARSAFVIAGPKYSGKTTSAVLAVRTLLKHISVPAVYFLVVQDDKAAIRFLEWLTGGQDAEHFANCTVYLHSNRTRTNEMSGLIKQMCWPAKNADTAPEVPLYIGTSNSFMRLSINPSETRRPPDVVIFDGVMGVNPLLIMGAAFAQGQPARVIFLLDMETPSPSAFLTADEDTTIRFGLREILESNKDVFPDGVLHGVNPKYGINLTRKFFTCNEHSRTLKTLYHPLLSEESHPNQENNKWSRNFMANAFDGSKPNFLNLILNPKNDAREENILDQRTFRNHMEAALVVFFVKTLLEDTKLKANTADDGTSIVAVTSVCRGQVMLLKEMMAEAMGNQNVPVLHFKDLDSEYPQILVVSMVRVTPIGDQDNIFTTLAADKHVRAKLLSMAKTAVFIFGDQKHLQAVWAHEMPEARSISAIDLFNKMTSPEVDWKDPKMAELLKDLQYRRRAERQMDPSNIKRGLFQDNFLMVDCEGSSYFVVPAFELPEETN